MILYGICVVDGERFEIPAEQVPNIGTEQEMKYCSPRCRGIAKRERYAGNRRCPACDGPFIPGPNYGSQMCKRCTTVAWLSCWRKQKRWKDKPPPRITFRDAKRGVLIMYHCLLCDGWHGTQHNTPPPPDWLEAVSKVAAHLKKIDFDPTQDAAHWRESGEQ